MQQRSAAFYNPHFLASYNLAIRRKQDISRALDVIARSSHLVRLKSTTPVLRPRKSPPSWPGILFRPRESLFPWPGILLSETKSRNSPAAFLYLRICDCRKISQGRYFQILFVFFFYLLTSVNECALIAIVIICSYFGSVKPNENIFFVFPPQGWVWRRCQQSRVGEERKLFVQLFHARPIVWLLKLSL